MTHQPHWPESRPLFVTGTDTGAGKSVLCLLMVRCCLDAGLAPAYLKPVQSGCVSPSDRGSDSRFIHDHIAEWKAVDPGDAVVYCFPAPKAPLFAARGAGTAINAERLVAEIDRRAGGRRPVIIEGAGGLLVHLTDRWLTVDLIQRLGAAPVLAARAGLGTINHTLLSLELLANRGLQPAGVILLDTGQAPLASDLVAENIAAIEGASGVCVAGVVEYIDDFQRLEAADLSAIRRVLGLRRRTAMRDGRRRL
jgi:dethiobiotin synthetase